MPDSPDDVANAPKRREHIQGLRAVAVGLVIAHHAYLPHSGGGFVGVDVFFVISGFVITLMLLRELNTSNRLNLWRFSVRRFRRLAPPLAVVVSVTVALSFVLTSPLGVQENIARSVPQILTLRGNHHIADTYGAYFDHYAQLSPMLHMWSLAVEEQFYLFFPLVVLVGWTVAAGRQGAGLVGAALAMAVVGGLSVAAMSVPAQGVWAFLDDWHLRGYFGAATRAWEFALGALVALWCAHRAGTRRLPGNVPGVAHIVVATLFGLLGVSGIVASTLLIDASTPFPGLWTMLPVVSTAAILAAGELAPNAPTQFLGAKPLAWVGDRSYGLYLWHWPMIVFAKQLAPNAWWSAPAGVLVAIALSALMFDIMEAPIRRRTPTASGLATARLVAASLVVPLALSVALDAQYQRGLRSDKVAALNAVISENHTGRNHGCDRHLTPAQQPDGACTWNPEGEGHVYLLGDSHADVVSTVLVDSATKRNARISVATGLACPMIYPEGWYSHGFDADRNELCRKFVSDTMTWVTQQPPGVVFLATMSNYWTSGEDVIEIGQRFTGDPIQGARRFEVALRDTVATLQGAGHRVVFMQTVPLYFWSPTYYDPAACTRLAIERDTCAATQSVTQVLDVQGPSRRVASRVGAELGVTVIDPIPALCAAGRCATHGAEGQLYRDTNHLTTTAVWRLAPAINEAVFGPEADAPGDTSVTAAVAPHAVGLAEPGSAVHVND